MTENDPPPSRTWKLDVCGQTDLGRQRTNNEDNFLVVDLDRAGSSNDNVCQVHDIGAKGSLLIVADGMGGANAGEVASQMAVEIISRQVTEGWSDANGQVPDDFLPRIVEAVKTSNREIKARGMEDDTKRGMGSTCVVAGVIAGKALLCNVGDSRGYLLRGSEVKQLTHDQSFVQHLLDVGAITKEQAVRSPRRNVVMEALGAREEVNVAQVMPLDLEHGDILVLCSDGLTGHVEDEEILRVAFSTTDQKERCKRLIELANERGGKDNITVIVAEVLEEGQPAVVRPQLPPIEPKPAEPPMDQISEPVPLPIALSPEEPLEPEQDMAGQGREYSLATGFILGLSVGLVASVIFLGEHLRGQRDELQKSYQHELAQKEAAAAAARMQLDQVQKALEGLQRKDETLEHDLAQHLMDWRKWGDEALAGKKQSHYPAEPDSINTIMQRVAPDPEGGGPGSTPVDPAPGGPEPLPTLASPSPGAIEVPDTLPTVAPPSPGAIEVPDTLPTVAPPSPGAIEVPNTLPTVAPPSPGAIEVPDTLPTVAPPRTQDPEPPGSPGSTSRPAPPGVDPSPGDPGLEAGLRPAPTLAPLAGPPASGGSLAEILPSPGAPASAAPAAGPEVSPAGWPVWPATTPDRGASPSGGAAPAGSPEAGEPDLGILPGLRPGPRSLPRAAASPRGAGSPEAGEPDLGILPGLRPGPRSPSLAPSIPRGAGSPEASAPPAAAESPAPVPTPCPGASPSPAVTPSPAASAASPGPEAPPASASPPAPASPAEPAAPVSPSPK